MKIKGTTQIIRDLKDLQSVISKKIDDVDWEKRNADAVDERLNQAWSQVDEAIEAINEIGNI